MVELAGNLLGVLPAAQERSPMAAVLVWSSGLILLVAGSVAIAWLRKRMNGAQDAIAAGFTLADLRDLRQKGAMTDEEFERAKAKLVMGMKASMKGTEKSGIGGASGSPPPTQKRGSP